MFLVSGSPTTNSRLGGEAIGSPAEHRPILIQPSQSHSRLGQGHPKTFAVPERAGHVSDVVVVLLGSEGTF